ncbi:MAG: GNAT family N-acetyltransferase [Victivallaceae bacterium]|nr:GNAT family N-acetyltransferase [Victivallaceae bacterium]
MNNMSITKVAKCDLPEILALQKRAFMEVARAIGKFELPALRQTEPEIAGEYDAGVILKCTAEDGRIVGSVRGRLDAENICRVGKLIVDPECQGHGIGGALMVEIEKYFPACAGFALFTSEETPHTFRLYTKLGYKVVGKKEMGGTVMLLMEK